MTFLEKSGARNVALRATLLSVIAIAVYILSLRFLAPGYFSPLAPFHLDFYDYTSMTGVPWSAVIRYPRFVTFGLFKVLGTWDVPPLMAAGIAVALAGVLLVLTFAARISPVSKRVPILGATLYFALLFTHPQFYIEHRHDMPATFSLLFLMLALHAWLSWLKRSSLPALVAAVVCALAFGFTKESFFLSVVALTAPLFVLYPSKRWQTAAFLGFCLAVEMASVLYSRSLSGPFVDPAAAAASAYHIDTHLTSILRVSWIYLRKLFLPPALLLLAVAFAQTIRSRAEALVAASLSAAGLAALGPISLLPNHVFTEYAWLAAPFVFAPVARLRIPRKGSKLQMAAIALAALTLVGYEAAARKEFKRDSNWYVQQEATARNLWRSLKRADSATAGAHRILVLGLKTPFPPWASGGYTEWRFGPHRYWNVIYPPGDFRFQSSRNVQFSRPAQADLAHADEALIFDANSRLSEALSRDDLHRRFPSRVDLVPELANLTSRSASELTDAGEAIRITDSLMQWSFAKEALPYYERAVALSNGRDADILVRLRRAQDQLASEARSRAMAAPAITINPAIATGDANGLAIVSLRWKAPEGTAVEIRVGRYDGALLANSLGSGSVNTGLWVRDNMVFYLQDVTSGKALTPENTLATATARVVSQ